MSDVRLGRLVVGTEDVEDAARVFEENLELPGTREGQSVQIAIGPSTIELSAGAQPLGMSRLVLEVADVDALEKRLREAGVECERDGESLKLEAAATHGVPLEIVRRTTS